MAVELRKELDKNSTSVLFLFTEIENLTKGGGYHVYRKTKNLINKKVVVRTSEISRKGLFAGEAIKKGEHILITDGQMKEWQFVNHSCDPNAWLRTSSDVETDALFAVRDIKKDEEITMDYRDTRWGEEYFYERIEKKYGGCRCLACVRKK